MSQICQLIAEEIKKIQNSGLTMENLTPGRYVDFEKTLPKQVEILNKLKAFLSLDEVLLNKMNEYLLVYLTDKDDLFSRIATSKENLNNKTLIYLGDLDLANCNESFDNLGFVLGDLNCNNYTANLANLKSVVGEAIFSYSTGNFPSLTDVSGNCKFYYSTGSFPALSTIGGSGIFNYSKIIFSNLISIGIAGVFQSFEGEVDKLERIGDYADFYSCPVKFFSLKGIGGNASFIDSKVFLPVLTTIVGGEITVSNKTNPDLIQLLKNLGKELIYL